ncbi:DinB family protein [Pseudoxanthomonas dokdonensis]|uniref:Diguanylate cyclase n=1 Tax=Pseudoxanthomonas dokdonensis TaxID=344882 RepID=A0A0R0CQM4_9GAMM|nr:DinB family protein [Pseudoxanthomonas dokdonensis]KRG68295.1 diguanylate cyclase [Pseudoxanthomonas dokdonensis]
MDFQQHFALLARYNQWMNQKLLEVSASLPAEALSAERGAFFGSILGTFNHLLVADTLWLKRLGASPDHATALQPLDAIPLPARLDQQLFADLAGLAERRQWLDAIIIAWVDGLRGHDLQDGWLVYHDTRGQPHRKSLAGVLAHLFNHQTHHRGQITTLLSQAGADVGVTDLAMLVPEQPLPV